MTRQAVFVNAPNYVACPQCNLVRDGDAPPTPCPQCAMWANLARIAAGFDEFTQALIRIEYLLAHGPIGAATSRGPSA